MVGEASATHYQGTLTIDAPLEAVWSLMNDPWRVADCVPGLEQLEEVVAEREYRGVVVLPLGGRGQALPALIYWGRRDAPRFGEMRVRTALGTTLIDVASTLTLQPAGPAATTLTWTADVSLPEATPAMQRAVLPMLQGVALRGVETFFDQVRARLEQPA